MPRSSGTQPSRRGRRASAERRPRSAPSRLIGALDCRCRPMTERSSVVLPAPLRPTRVTTSPGRDVDADVGEHAGLAVPGGEPGDLEHARAGLGHGGRAAVEVVRSAVRLTHGLLRGMR